MDHGVKLVFRQNFLGVFFDAFLGTEEAGRVFYHIHAPRGYFFAACGADYVKGIAHVD